MPTLSGNVTEIVMPRANDYLMLLLEAQQREIGIVVESDDPLALRMALYKERGKTAEFLEFSFVLSPDNPKTELWILRNRK